MFHPDEDMQKQIEFGRIVDFFGKAKSVYLGLAFNISFTSVLIAPYTKPAAIGLWILATIICYMPRIIVTRRFFKLKKSKQLTIDNIGPWERQVYLHSILPFIAFSSISFVPFTSDAFTGAVIVALALVALLVGGVIIYSASLKVVSLYLYISMGCIIARCLYEGGYQFYILAFYLFGVVIIVRQLMNTQYGNLVDYLTTRLQFERASLRDPLTGISNRRHLEIFLKDFIPVSQRTGNEFQVVMMDIDHFKKYNDTHGHLKGDELLTNLASLVNKHIRSSDFFARYGGEEFALILTANSRETALGFVKSLMDDIRKSLGITISAGLSSSDMSDSFEQLLDLADQALYQSKQNGRNQISISQRESRGQNS